MDAGAGGVVIVLIGTVGAAAFAIVALAQLERLRSDCDERHGYFGVAGGEERS